MESRDLIQNLISKIELLEKRVSFLERERRVSLLFWEDVETSLFWELKDGSEREKLYNFWEAENYVKELNEKNYGGFSDWRIPEKDELESLFEENQEFFIKKELFQNMPKKFKAIFWTKTENIDAPEICVTVFNNGFSDWKYRTHQYFIMAVRS